MGVMGDEPPNDAPVARVYPEPGINPEWVTEQENLRARVVQEDDRDWQNIDNFLVGGSDISFVKGTDFGCAGLVVCEYPALNVIYEDVDVVNIKEPYIPGFLSFREKEPLLTLLGRYREKDLEPLDLIMIDGNGILHPRRFGLACHIGVASNLPSIGIAKNEFKITNDDNVDPGVRKDWSQFPQVGSSVELKDGSGEPLGFALRTTDGSKKPVYVSVGHRISLTTAVDLVLRCCRNRVPEPVRQADIRTREFLRKHYSEISRYRV